MTSFWTTCEQNEKKATEFCKETGAIYVLHCTSSEADIWRNTHDVRFKSSADAHKDVVFFMSTFPHNRYVLFSPQAFIALKDAHRREVSAISNLRERDLAARQKDKIRVDDRLKALVSAIKNRFFLRLLFRLYKLNHLLGETT